jgi:hypothetical protein
MIETEVAPSINLPDSPIPDTLTIVITPEDVKEGKRSDVGFCVVALATKRALKEWNVDSVVAAYYSVGTLNGIWAVPPKLRESMKEWDDGGKFTALGEHHLPKSRPLFANIGLKYSDLK